jgi:hypothetical protein
MEKSSFEESEEISQNNNHNTLRDDKKKRLNVNHKVKKKECHSNIFEYNHLIDVPHKVIVTYKYKNSLYFKVEFYQRHDGIVADPKIFSFKYLKWFYPEFLVDVLETCVNNSILND